MGLDRSRLRGRAFSQLEVGVGPARIRGQRALGGTLADQARKAAQPNSAGVRGSRSHSHLCKDTNPVTTSACPASTLSHAGWVTPAP